MVGFAALFGAAGDWQESTSAHKLNGNAQWDHPLTIARA